jgi:predicted transcriptional regulator
MRVLVIDVASDSQWDNRTADFFTDPDRERTYISFIQPTRVLRLLNETRFKIVQLLMRHGPLGAGDIAARLGRNRLMTERDLETLLESEVIERDRACQYYFEFAAIRVVLQWPLPGGPDANDGQRPARNCPAPRRGKASRRTRLRNLSLQRPKR